MKHQEDIKRLYGEIKKIAGKNEALADEINRLLLAAGDEKDRRVLTPNGLTCLVSQLKQKRAQINENNALIESAFEEMYTYAIGALGEGFRHF